ncbi:DNA cytosine methyltransferase [Methylocystis parvus]|uniref:Cytosine-specific methyltransferase n=1 Tax=Methylocystis parvus TaxID=134 RepID=A0A6B8M5X6_9HYPH|nr:DNA (cytosine-5-)-methyltransferase [Methylocystis parvus]QGM99414.1 DNA cytosine methyltransferase [Methylocystis parvus]WBK00194.1 DNA (cytosine-5-)-methyltransferase [Methylocystis parvus OBBP]
MPAKPTFYEFFAGGGMARAGLGEGWTCLFANDVDARKAESYRRNWGGEALHVGDVAKVATAQLPGRADLVWASFPCQDLSLAGAGAGLKGARSGSFWPFWSLMKALRAEGRAPTTIVLENVCGALTSHGGKDFTSICAALADEGYRFGALVIDAALFLPQSRPRLFIVAAREDVATLDALSTLPRYCEEAKPTKQSKGGDEALDCFAGLAKSGIPDFEKMLAMTGRSPFVSRALIAAYNRLPDDLKANWLWWRLPAPPPRNATLANVIEDPPHGVCWHDAAKTQRLIGLMSDVNLAKIEEAKRAGRKMVGALYRRTRYENSEKVQRAEARFDDVAGCLRTPAGGSSRQFVLVVEKGEVRSRLISARETARLMGLPDDYILPERYNEAYHLTGDGVVVPAVRHIAAHLIEPLLKACVMREAA